MGGFSREYANDDIQDDGSDIGSDELEAEAGVDERSTDGYR